MHPFKSRMALWTTSFGQGCIPWVGLWIPWFRNRAHDRCLCLERTNKGIVTNKGIMYSWSIMPVKCCMRMIEGQSGLNAFTAATMGTTDNLKTLNLTYQKHDLEFSAIYKSFLLKSMFWVVKWKQNWNHWGLTEERIFCASAPKVSRTRAATPSPSRRSPSSTCSVPM